MNAQIVSSIETQLNTFYAILEGTELSLYWKHESGDLLKMFSSVEISQDYNVLKILKSVLESSSDEDLLPHATGLSILGVQLFFEPWIRQLTIEIGEFDSYDRELLIEALTFRRVPEDEIEFIIENLDSRVETIDRRIFVEKSRIPCYGDILLLSNKCTILPCGTESLHIVVHGL